MTGFYLFYVILTKSEVIKTADIKSAIKILIGLLLSWIIDLACLTFVVQKIVIHLNA